LKFLKTCIKCFFFFLKEENHLLIVENRTHQAHVLQVHNKRENFKKNFCVVSKNWFQPDSQNWPSSSLPDLPARKIEI
jgi:hypothetical protein